jgi:cell division protein FtsA
MIETDTIMNTLTCAIEFGSSHINAIAARRDENGHVSVLAVESEPSNGCVRHGCVQSIEEAAAKVKSLILKLGNRLSAQMQAPVAIGKAYVGIAGISIHSISHHPSLHLEEGTRITTDILEHLRSESRKMVLGGYDVLGVENSYYKLDGRQCQNPLDQTCSEITAYNQLIVARSYLKQHLKATMDRAGIETAGYIILPLSTAAILSETERQAGCILVNFGAETTTVSVYKPTLQHLAVIPLGGEVVTRDIMSCGLSHDKAEEAKRSWSSACGQSGDVRPSAIEQEAIGVETTLLNTVVQARYEEIVANIKHQIEQSHLEGELNGGFIITGDASFQKGLSTLLSQLNLAVKTRSYTNITASGTEKRLRYSSLLSMIALATVDCEKPRTVAPQQSVVSPQNLQSVPPTQAAPAAPVVQQQPPIVETTYAPQSQPTEHRETPEPQKQHGGLRNHAVRLIKDLFRQEEN